MSGEALNAASVPIRGAPDQAATSANTTSHRRTGTPLASADLPWGRKDPGGHGPMGRDKVCQDGGPVRTGRWRSRAAFVPWRGRACGQSNFRRAITMVVPERRESKTSGISIRTKALASRIATIGRDGHVGRPTADLATISWLLKTRDPHLRRNSQEDPSNNTQAHKGKISDGAYLSLG